MRENKRLIAKRERKYMVKRSRDRWVVDGCIGHETRNYGVQKLASA